MTALDSLVAKLRADGLDVTREQAERMAVRISGSVQAYLAMIAQQDAELAEYQPLEGEPGDKFTQPLGPPKLVD